MDDDAVKKIDDEEEEDGDDDFGGDIDIVRKGKKAPDDLEDADALADEEEAVLPEDSFDDVDLW